jgi:hypothetical protein
VTLDSQSSSADAMAAGCDSRDSPLGQKNTCSLTLRSVRCRTEWDMGQRVISEKSIG